MLLFLPHRYGASSARFWAISRSQRSPLARSFSLLKDALLAFRWQREVWPSTIHPPGRLLSKRNNAFHHVNCHAVVRRVPSLRRGPASIVMAWAGQMARRAAVKQRSSPLGRRSACSPGTGLSGPSHGIVQSCLGLTKFRASQVADTNSSEKGAGILFNFTAFTQIRSRAAAPQHHHQTLSFTKLMIRGGPAWDL